jgi:hypothetical protein
LAALEALLSEVTDPWPAKDFESNVESARAAIAKAMGTKPGEVSRCHAATVPCEGQEQ